MFKTRFSFFYTMFFRKIQV